MKEIKTPLIRYLAVLTLGICITSGNISARESDKKMSQKEVEKLPPEPDKPYPSPGKKEEVKMKESEIPRVSQDIDSLDVPEGREIVLDVYTIKKGDYLAKLARQEYGDRDLWKVIYNYNKYIGDPHWVFPGDKIIMPRIVNELPEVPKEKKKPVKKEEKKEKRERDYNNFVAPMDFRFLATVTGFKASRALYSQGDYLFIDIGYKDGIRENDRLNIYEVGRQIVHPYTGEILGQVVTRIGAINVTGDISEYDATAQIIYSEKPVQKGHMLLRANR